MIAEGTEAWKDLLGQRNSRPNFVGIASTPLKRDWRGNIHPSPVYVATFADGQTVRMSFWNRKGKPWDIERGRALCVHWHRTLTGQDHEFVAGHVEHNGIVQDIAAKPARQRITTKQLKATLAAIINLPDLPAAQQHHEATRLMAEARDLLAA